MSKSCLTSWLLNGISLFSGYLDAPKKFRFFSWLSSVQKNPYVFKLICIWISICCHIYYMLSLYQQNTCTTCTSKIHMHRVDGQCVCPTQPQHWALAYTVCCLSVNTVCTKSCVVCIEQCVLCIVQQGSTPLFVSSQPAQFSSSS